MADAPLTTVAAITREAIMVKNNGPALRVRALSSKFTPLAWEAFGRIGPAGNTVICDTFSSPSMRPVRATLLRDVALPDWRASARLAGQTARCLRRLLVLLPS